MSDMYPLQVNSGYNGIIRCQLETRKDRHTL